MSDIKTEVIVNGSWRASCDMCFQGIDEDTSTVRVLLLYCLWESAGHVHVHLLTLPLSLLFSFFKCSSSSIVVCCLFTCTDRPLLHIPFPSLYSFFSSSIDDGETEWDTYVCDNRSFMLLLIFSSVHMAGNATKRMRKSRGDIDYDQFSLLLYIYTIGREKKLLVLQKRKIDSWE